MPVSGRTILVVDDEPDVRDMLHDQLVHLGYLVRTAASAEAALREVELVAPDLVLTDVHMHGISGVELCRRLKADPRFTLTPVVILTAVTDLDARVAGLAADAVALGHALGVPEPLRRALHLGGYLHDLGKIAVPDTVLLKEGALSPAEIQQIQRHPGVGADLVRGLHTLDEVRPIIRHHHERCDGSGYPDGLRGEAIPLGARIMAVVDVFDALHTARPYKPALSTAEALAILKAECDAGAWDPRVVARFVEIVSDLSRRNGDVTIPGGRGRRA